MRLPRPEVDDQEWPDSKPPFPAGAASVTPEGTLWVQRHVRFGGAATYDEFGPSGERIRQVILPAGRRLVGFGPGKLYAVHVDDDDLQWLEVYKR